MSHPEFAIIKPHIVALVPVPMHWYKRFRRGYNQALDLSLELSLQTKIPTIQALKRVRYNSAQASLDQESRRRNLRGAFQINKRELKKLKLLLGHNKNALVALVDDVATTGTTAELCAAALGRAGIKNVILLCVAKT